jgi:hypothetical protein
MAHQEGHQAPDEADLPDVTPLELKLLDYKRRAHQVSFASGTDPHLKRLPAEWVTGGSTPREAADIQVVSPDRASSRSVSAAGE